MWEQLSQLSQFFRLSDSEFSSPTAAFEEMIAKIESHWSHELDVSGIQAGDCLNEDELEHDHVEMSEKEIEQEHEHEYEHELFL